MLNYPKRADGRWSGVVGSVCGGFTLWPVQKTRLISCERVIAECDVSTFSIAIEDGSTGIARFIPLGIDAVRKNKTIRKR